MMREKAEEKKRLAALGGGAGAPVIGRKMTLAKKLSKEEDRITASQVGGTTMSFAEQLAQAGNLLKPATKDKLGSFGKNTANESARPKSETLTAKMSRLSTTQEE